jgi:uncharacterized protein YndB with AHSA1/START domain
MLTMENKTKITVECTINETIEKVWNYWTAPKHIEQWNNASDDWHTPKAINDSRVGGKFIFTMAAKDGSFSFDFGGTYTEVIINKVIKYTMDDGRTAAVDFVTIGATVEIIETFEAENQNPIEMQKGGWQAILNNFKKYVENN